MNSGMRTRQTKVKPIRMKQRPIRMKGKRTSKRSIAATLLVTTGLAALATAFAFGSGPSNCTLSLQGDGTMSGSDPALVAERIQGAHQVLARYADKCSKVVVQSINALPGQGAVWSGPLGSDSDNTLDARAESKRRVEDASKQIERVFSTAPSRGTAIVRSLYDLEDMVDGNETMIVYSFTDGLETEAINLHERMSERELEEAVRNLRPLDDSSWQVHFVGVHRTADGGVSEAVAQNAERFWRRLLGESLQSYALALQF